MIHQLNTDGLDKVETAIQLIRDYATIFHNQAKEQGFFVAFSGGKDSCVVKKLCDMAEVRYDAHYNVTTVDPPELVRFIKAEYPDVIFEKHYYERDGIKVKKGDQITMKNLIPEKLMPPTRIVRYCCQLLKETAGDGRLTITGVRKAESTARAQSQGVATIYDIPKKEKKELVDSGNFRQTKRGGVVLVNDNEDGRKMIEQCYARHKTVLNPIIDWSDAEVWEFIREYNVPYCKLYDEGFKRLGCIGCPMSTHAREELERWPTIKKVYLQAFQKMIEVRRERERETSWKTAEEVMEWWLGK